MGDPLRFDDLNEHPPQQDRDNRASVRPYSTGQEMRAPPRGILELMLDSARDMIFHKSPFAMLARAVERHTPIAEDYNPGRDGYLQDGKWQPGYAPRSREEIAAARAARVTQRERDARATAAGRNADAPAWIDEQKAKEMRDWDLRHWRPTDEH